MLIRDIILREANRDLVGAIEDIIAIAMSKDIKTIPTNKFLSILAKRGYVVTADELIHAAGTSKYVSSVDKENINTADQMNVDQGIDATVDVGDMASSQAMSDIKADL